MAKIIISLLIPLLVSCSILNRNARSSVSTMCVDLLSARVAVDVPTPGNFRKGIYEGGVCYASTYHDGTIIFNEESFARFDVEDYKPLGSEHRKKYSIYWGNESLISRGQVYAEMERFLRMDEVDKGLKKHDGRKSAFVRKTVSTI